MLGGSGSLSRIRAQQQPKLPTAASSIGTSSSNAVVVVPARPSTTATSSTANKTTSPSSSSPIARPRPRPRLWMNNPAVNKKKRKSSSSSSPEDDNTYRLHQYGGYTFHSDDEESESEDEQEDNDLGYDPYYAGLGANTKKYKRRRVPRRVGHNQNHHPGAKRRHWGDLSISSAAVTFSSDECDDDDGTARRVRFSRQIVSDVQYRPYTAREDVRDLFYSKADERRFRAEYAEWKRTSSLFDCDEDEDDSSSESESDDGEGDGCGEEAIVDIDEQWRPPPPGDDDDLEEQQQGAAAEEEGDLDDLLSTAHEDSPSPTTVSPDVSDEDEMEEAEAAAATTSDNDDESTDSESEEDEEA